MKTYPLILLGMFLFVSCTQNVDRVNENVKSVDNNAFFGEKIDPENSEEVTDLISRMGTGDSLHIKLKGKISDVCQKKGCWLELDMGNSQTLRVTFKDYGFFVPKDCAGKETVFEGVAYHDTTSVEMLKHYAEDAGQPADEIAKITEPEVNIAFEASGVIIKE